MQGKNLPKKEENNCSRKAVEIFYFKKLNKQNVSSGNMSKIEEFPKEP
jgi:hypothetical protein